MDFIVEKIKKKYDCRREFIKEILALKNKTNPRSKGFLVNNLLPFGNPALFLLKLALIKYYINK